MFAYGALRSARVKSSCSNRKSKRDREAEKRKKERKGEWEIDRNWKWEKDENRFSQEETETRYISSLIWASRLYVGFEDCKLQVFSWLSWAWSLCCEFQVFKLALTTYASFKSLLWLWQLMQASSLCVALITYASFTLLGCFDNICKC